MSNMFLILLIFNWNSMLQSLHFNFCNISFFTYHKNIIVLYVCWSHRDIIFILWRQKSDPIQLMNFLFLIIRLFKKSRLNLMNSSCFINEIILRFFLKNSCTYSCRFKWVAELVGCVQFEYFAKGSIRQIPKSRKY